MGIPRWIIWVAIAVALIWVINDPAGAAQFLNSLADSIKTFFKNLG